MKLFRGLIFMSLVAYLRCECNSNYCDMEDQFVRKSLNETEVESRLSAQIIAVLDHYKQTDPIGIPGSLVTDPIPVPDASHAVFMGQTLTMRNSLAYGISKFRLKNFAMDAKQLMVTAEIKWDVIQIIGNYTLASVFSSTEGPFNVTITNIVAAGNTSVAVERDGKVRTQDISMDMSFSSLTTDFENLGLMGSLFQSVINNAPDMVFDTMKPYMLKEAYSNIRTEIDTNIEKMMGDYTLPNSISPLDMAIAEGRKIVRNLGYDPLIIRNYNHSIGIFSIQLKNTWIDGVSSFFRNGDVLIGLNNHTITIVLNLGTQLIKGSKNWEVTTGKGFLTRIGHISFFVEFIRATINMSQTLDTRNHPQISNIQLEVGNIQIQSDGAGTFDYVIEFAVNFIPNLLRYQIMDALEYPVKAKIQDEFNRINVEKIIKSNIPAIERMCKKGTFSLSDFKL